MYKSTVIELSTAYTYVIHRVVHRFLYVYARMRAHRAVRLYSAVYKPIRVNP